MGDEIKIKNNSARAFFDEPRRVLSNVKARESNEIYYIDYIGKDNMSITYYNKQGRDDDLDAIRKLIKRKTLE